MSDPERADETRRWMRFARDDLRGAEVYMERSELPPRLACFHAQQAAEKALKALLIARDTEFPKTHELLGLSQLLSETFDPGVGVRELAELSKWAVEPRYPGNVPEATQSDAEAAIKQARKVYDTTLEGLKSHGYTPEGE